jgi:polysaccharide pyruvyl transferase WcaK-like protein
MRRGIAKMIVLRLDSEHRNLGDKAINASQIIVLRKVSDKHKTKLTLIVPGLHKHAIIAGLEALPDITDVFQTFKVPKNKIFRDLAYIAFIIIYITMSLLPSSIIRYISEASDNMLGTLSKIILTLRNTRLLVISGGGFIQDKWYKSTMVPIILFSLIAKLYRTRCIILPQTIGPFTRPLGIVLMKIILRLVDIIYCRDYYNYVYVSKLFKLTREVKARIRWFKDVGFLVYYRYLVKDLHYVRREKLCIHVREWPPCTQETLLGLLMSEALKFKGEIMVIVMEPSELTVANKLVRSLLERFIKATLYEPRSYLDVLRELYTNCAEVIGISYHLLLASASLGIPAIAIYPDDYYALKLKGLKLINPNLKFVECVEYVT